MKKSKQTVSTMLGESLIAHSFQNIPVFDYHPVLELSDDLSFMVYCYCQNLPREFRNSIGKDLKKNLAELTTLIHKTKTATEELALIEETVGCLEVIGLRIRLLYGFKHLSAEQFTLLAQHMDEISRQLQTWKKDIRKRRA
jgi:hypothetical protein